MNEEWRGIDGFGNLYQVSNYGRIRSCDRYSRNPKKHLVVVKGNMLKPWKSQGGYETVYLCEKGSKRAQKIHRLVAIAFIPNPENKTEVNHIDGNRSNNHFSNLEWVTKSENNKHSYDKLGRISALKGKRGKECANSKKIDQYSLSGEFIKTWDSMMDVERKLGIKQSNISKCCRGKFKNMGGFVWTYSKMK